MYRFRTPWSTWTCMVAVFCMLFVPLLTGCGEDAVMATAPEQTQNPQIPPEFAEMQAQGELIQQWVARMDPYVTQNSDGTYTMDWQAFQQELARTDPQIALSLNRGATPTKDTEVILDLKNGIPLANKALKEQSDGVMQVASYWCSWYWWGRKCCYTGNNAEDVIDDYELFSALPGIGFVFSGYSWLFKRLLRNCGGFCFYKPWTGGTAWVSCP